MREIRELRRRGWEIHTLAIRRAEQLLDSRSSDPPTWHVVPRSWRGLLVDHLAALLSRPRRYLAALGFALATGPSGLRARLWQVFYFLEAVVLWRHLHGLGIRHVHVHFALAVASVAMIASRLGDLTYSITIHGSTEFFNVDANLLARKVALARLVICISHFCRAQVLCCTAGRAGEKMHVVRCGVDADDYAPMPPREPAGEALRILTVGRLIPVKGLDTLMRAVACLRRQKRTVEWTIVGDGPERPALERLARKLEIEQAVHFAGSVEQDRIQSYYEQADVYVLPSYAEGLPVVLMEAMAKQIPVVASSIAGVPELVEKGHSGLLVPPGDVEQLARAIGRLADDPALRQRLGCQGRRQVVAKHDIRRIGEELDALFQGRSPAAAVESLEAAVSEAAS
jgi:glycosyltransferase involved in cell wall biosynthesis